MLWLFGLGSGLLLEFGLGRGLINNGFQGEASFDLADFRLFALENGRVVGGFNFDISLDWYNDGPDIASGTLHLLLFGLHEQLFGLLAGQLTVLELADLLGERQLFRCSFVKAD